MKNTPTRPPYHPSPSSSSNQYPSFNPSPRRASGTTPIASPGGVTLGVGTGLATGMNAGTRERRQSVAYVEQVSFRPGCVTCFGDYILACLMSSSRSNYLAIWGPEFHLCETQELTVETAKFCKPLPSGSIVALSLRVLFIGNTVRFVIHATSSDRIERWLLNEVGVVLENTTKNLEIPIDAFSIDRTGNIMISYENNFIILRDNELRVFHSIKYGKEIPTSGIIIPQLHTGKYHLISCYESGLVAGWEIPFPTGQENRIDSVRIAPPQQYQQHPQPIFHLNLSTKSSLCGIVEVMNSDRLHHRRFCVVSRGGQIWQIEWSTRDLSVCSEIRHADMKKALRYQLPSTSTQQQPTNTIGIRDEIDTPASSAPSVHTTISILSICSCPDISFSNYTPHGDRPADMTIEQWRNYQTNVVPQTSKGILKCSYRPSLCLLTSLGTAVIVDIESFKLVRNRTDDTLRGTGIISSAISSLNVLEFKSKFLQDHGEENSDASSEASDDHFDDESNSPSPRNDSIRGNFNSRLHTPVGLEEKIDRVHSPNRRRSSVAVRRGSTSTVHQPPQLLADFKALLDLRKTIAAKYGQEITVSAFSVALGGFDRKIIVRPILLPSQNREISPKKKMEPREPTQTTVVNAANKKIMTEEDHQARSEVSRLPLWAMTLKEDVSKDSLGEKHLIEEGKIGDSSTPRDIPFSFFHDPYFQLNALPDKSPLAALNVDEKQQPQSARAKTPSKVRGDWEAPKRTAKGEILDQPVTFHTRIKSSGYGVADVTTNRWKQKKQPSSGNSQSRSRSAPRSSGVTNPTTVASRLRMYPRECGALTQIQEYNNYPPPVSSIKQIPIMKINFSGDGTMIGVVSAGNDVGTLRTPIGRFRGDGLYYLGHDAQVNSIEFAHKSDLLLSSSADCTARLWKSGRVDSAVVVFSHKRHNPVKIGGNSSSINPSRKLTPQSRNAPFSGAIQSASFFYQDKFVLLTTKTSVLMYTYDLDDLEHENDLKRLQATGKYRLVHEWSYDAAQHFTMTACMNSVQSPTIISASSDRKLLLFDAVSGKISHTFDSHHDRSIHCIALPQPSLHVPLSQSTYNMFATSSTDNVISLWDIRTPQIVMRFTDHINRREKIQCAFSPCMRYLATGSEDRTTRLIDLQSGGRQIAKLVSPNSPQRDVVSSVAFHPIHPQLIAGSYDGTIRCFTCVDT